MNEDYLTLEILIKMTKLKNLLELLIILILKAKVLSEMILKRKKTRTENTYRIEVKC